MKYYLDFTFTETEEQARKICENYQKTATPYARKHHKAHFTPWEAADGKGNAHFIAFTYYRR